MSSRVDINVERTARGASSSRLSEQMGLLSIDEVFLLMVVDSSTIKRRSHVQHFTNIIDTIVSPNYPANYDNNDNRVYIIEAPTKRDIVLIFKTFDVEYDRNCAFDSLTASTFLTSSTSRKFQYYLTGLNYRILYIGSILRFIRHVIFCCSVTFKF